LNIGNAQTEPKGENYLEIQRIYFYKTYQGGGRGQKFIQLALDKAKELNKNKVWLGVWEHNQQALSFYKKHGFEVTGQHEFITGEVVDIDLIMEREI
ncbi:GNAT family N-acetyltransferase, partial [Staphylococcus haemolyticus]